MYPYSTNYINEPFWGSKYKSSKPKTKPTFAPMKPKRAKNKKKMGTPSQRKKARRKRAKSSRVEGFQIGIEEPKGFHELNRLRRKKRISYFANGGKA